MFAPCFSFKTKQHSEVFRNLILKLTAVISLYNTGVPFSTLFIDLDDTLYPSTSGLWEAIRGRMSVYMQERLGLSPEIVPELRRSYVEKYGTTLRGLQANFQVEPYEFLDFVHNLPLDQYLEPDPDLPQVLSGLPQPKWILTNADARHAGRVLAYFGIAELFSGVIDIHRLGYICKPEEEAYRRALNLVGETDPTVCVFFDDSNRNLAPARHLGFTTVLVGRTGPDPSAHYTITSFKELPVVFPDLWEFMPAPGSLK